jgi:hypothetical protein
MIACGRAKCFSGKLVELLSKKFYSEDLPFAQVTSPFPFFQWRKRLYGKNSSKEMTEGKIGDILGL